MPRALEGKIAIVTGGGGGIGAATCAVLADRGASVVVADIDMARAEAVAAELAGRARAIPVKVDLADEAQIAALFDETFRIFGRLDIIDNNAAIQTPELVRKDRDIASMETETWDLVHRVNLRGTMLCCRSALRIMEKQRSGVIVNTASNLALQGNVIQAAYSAAKAAIIQMTRSIATSHGHLGIRCNAVLPGLTGSKAALQNLPPRLLEIVGEETLTPYLGDPIDIANTVAFLVSDDARYITGQTIVADGGTSVHVPGYARFREMLAEETA